MDKLPITCFICNRNGRPHLDNALQSVGFCDQIIFVDDSSDDGSVGSALRYGAEVFPWYGSDSMGERRNYAVGFTGNDEHTPEWVSHPIMSKNVPKIKNEWVFYIDHDELIVQDPNFPPIYEEFEKLINGTHEKNQDVEASMMFLNNIKDDGRLSMIQTGVPLMRIFKRDKIWFQEKSQNKVRHGDPVGIIFVKFLHFGYSEEDYQLSKMWKRTPDLQTNVIKEPDDYMRRVYLLNNISGMCQNNLHLEEGVAQFLAIKKRFLADEDREKPDIRKTVQAAVRHFWYMMYSQGQLGEFLRLTDGVWPYIDNVPDSLYYLFIANYDLGDTDKALLYGERYFQVLEEYLQKGIQNIEMESLNQNQKVANVLSQIYWVKGDMEKSRDWDNKFRELA